MIQVHFIGWSKSILGLIVFSFIAYYRITTAGEESSGSGAVYQKNGLCHSEPALSARNLLAAGNEKQIPRAIIPRFGMTSLLMTSLLKIFEVHHYPSSLPFEPAPSSPYTYRPR